MELVLQPRPASSSPSTRWLNSFINFNRAILITSRGTGRISNDGAGRRETQSSDRPTWPHSGIDSAVSSHALHAPYMSIDLQSITGNNYLISERPSDTRTGQGAQVVLLGRNSIFFNQARPCTLMPKKKSTKRRLAIFIASATFLVSMIAIYMAFNAATDLNRELHILLIFMIFILSIVFCHSLIRFGMIVLQGPRSARNRIPSKVGPAGYAQPEHPIHVIIAGDEEALADSHDPIREKVTVPPPAYGLWRSSVRINPNLLYWQRVDGTTPLPKTITRTDESLSRGSPLPRPPSYISDDGVSYVIEAQPRSIHHISTYS